MHCKTLTMTTVLGLSCSLAVKKLSRVHSTLASAVGNSWLTTLLTAAGADIKEMKDLSFSQAYNTNFIASWSSTIPNIRKPIVAAVNGHALGGGCELALMADIIYCSSSATFGQPEIKLGIIPGAGGSQRLTALIGKSRAMELILTGKNFSGTEAGQWGVAARVFDSAQECVQGALETAEKIAGFSKLSVRAAKEVVNKSQETSLREGLDYERKVFHGLFGSKDQKIGELLPVNNNQSKRSLFTDIEIQECLLSLKRRNRSGQTSNTKAACADELAHHIMTWNCASFRFIEKHSISEQRLSGGSSSRSYGMTYRRILGPPYNVHCFLI